jgi:hypothetical protein
MKSAVYRAGHELRGLARIRRLAMTECAPLLEHLATLPIVTSWPMPVVGVAAIAGGDVEKSIRPETDPVAIVVDGGQSIAVMIRSDMTSARFGASRDTLNSDR